MKISTKLQIIINSIFKNTDTVMIHTIGEEGLWMSPAYFAFDKNITIYILLESNSMHMKNIWVNKKASIGINISNGRFMGFILEILCDVKIFNINNKKYKDFYESLCRFHGLDSGENKSLKLIKFVPVKFFLSSLKNPNVKEELNIKNNYRDIN